MVLDNFHTTILQDVGIEYDRGEARQFLERTAIELILTVKKICIRELLLGITTHSLKSDRAITWYSFTLGRATPTTNIE